MYCCDLTVFRALATGESCASKKACETLGVDKEVYVFGVPLSLGKTHIPEINIFKKEHLNGVSGGCY